MEMFFPKRAACVALLCFACAPVVSQAAEPSKEPTRPVRAIISGIDGTSVTGYLSFSASGTITTVRGTIEGLSPGKHGIHVHEGTSCDDRGSHYNPTATAHGSPDQPFELRHVGDLGNLVADAVGVAHFERVDPVIKLYGENTIVGRVVTIHDGEDDYITQPSGNSGTQIGCGVIKRIWQQ